MNRRSFLTLLAGGAGIVAAAPVRRYWAVGATLERGIAKPTLSPFMGMDLGFRGSTGAISQRWHESDLVRELQGYPGGEAPNLTLASIRDAVQTLKAQNAAPHPDGRYRAYFHPTTAKQVHAVVDIQMAQMVSDGYIVCDDDSPIIVRTEIVGGVS